MNKLKTMKSGVSRTLQRGASMLEIMGALVIGALITVGVVNQANSYVDDLKDATTADHLRAYGQAARAYVSTNKDKLLSELGVGATSRVAARPLAEYLPSGFSNVMTNPYGHSPCLLVKRGSDNELKAMLFTEQPDTSDRYKIETPRQKFISVMAGLGAGYVEGAEAKGPGWKDNATGWSGGCGGLRTNNSLALSLDLYQPGRERDCRYLSVDAPVPAECGRTLNRDLEFQNPSAIRNLSAIYPPENGTLQLKESVNVEQNLFAGGNVTVGGGNLSIRGAKPTVQIGGTSMTAINGTLGLSGTFAASDGLVTELFKNIGEPCDEYQVGTIARSNQSSAPSGGITPGGLILSCQQRTPGGPKLWQNMVAEAGEELGAIIGCNWHNNFCKWDWTTARSSSPNFFKKLAGHIESLGQCLNGDCLKKLTQNDSGGNTRHGWEIEIGERAFCALGFYAVGSSVSSNIPDGKLAVDQAIGACRVLPTGSRNGRTVWVLRAIASTDQNVPDGNSTRDRGTVQVSCHAVCIK